MRHIDIKEQRIEEHERLKKERELDGCTFQPQLTAKQVKPVYNPLHNYMGGPSISDLNYPSLENICVDQVDYVNHI